MSETLTMVDLVAALFWEAVDKAALIWLPPPPYPSYLC